MEQFLNQPSQYYQLTSIYENCTVLFADIAGFTKFSSSVEPNEVVTMLKELFTAFDQSCLEHNVFKLYTIGDCYVVLGVTNAAERSPLEEAISVINFGFQMINTINQKRQEIGFLQLNMRIGIHTGTIIGGVIGTDIIRYDIYGQDVMIANKMESNGIEGKVVVSETTKALLELQAIPQFNFNFHKEILFSQNIFNSYWVEEIQ